MRCNRRATVLDSFAVMGSPLAGCVGDQEGTGDDDEAEADDYAGERGDGDDDLDDYGDVDGSHNHGDDHGLHFDEIGAEAFHLLHWDKDPPEEIAHMHGDHWHDADRFPTIPLDGSVPIGARVEDEHGDGFELGEEFELHASVVDGADDILAIEMHGDHVDLIGDEEGDTEITFSLWHDDHTDYRTDTIEVTVAEVND